MALQNRGKINMKSEEFYESSPSLSGLKRQVTIENSDHKWQVLL